MNELEKLEKELLQEIQEEPQIYADTEEFCTIDPETRIITVPPSKRTLGTESDQETNRLYFKCPKMVGDNVDLSLFSLRINYQNAGNKKDQYLVEDVKEEGDNITFSWLLKRNVTAYKGNVKFILCAVKTTEDGAIKNEWNTTLNDECECLEGMEVDQTAVEEETKDIVEQLIAMMNHSAENAVRAVEAAKAEVDKEVGDFALKAQQALVDVNNAGHAQMEEINNVGSDTIGDIQKNIEVAQNTKTELENTIRASGESKEALSGAITESGTAITKVNESIKNAGTAVEETVAATNETKKATEAAQSAESKLSQSTADAEELKTALDQAVSGVAQDATAEEILKILQKSAEYMAQIAESAGKAGSLNGFGLNLLEDGSVSLTYSDPDTGELQDSAIFPKETTLTALDKALGEMNESLKIIALREGGAL